MSATGLTTSHRESFRCMFSIASADNPVKSAIICISSPCLSPLLTISRWFAAFPLSSPSSLPICLPASILSLLLCLHQKPYQGSLYEDSGGNLEEIVFVGEEALLMVIAGLVDVTRSSRVRRGVCKSATTTAELVLCSTLLLQPFLTKPFRSRTVKQYDLILIFSILRQEHERNNSKSVSAAS
ncbi:hypothetical protein H206_05334 [Candidatus Electrothrix aarhusensis]|uniref:Uncharacterized protein n=1 Tax=Candidatus Electrothrix aarhusensis TaxID=1859131 RepID=A0A3S3UE68_9BACT|nr:hypothetical protein H206_05334 [Candidatus Electrothrix aarhusensis]